MKNPKNTLTNHIKALELRLSNYKNSLVIIGYDNIDLRESLSVKIDMLETFIRDLKTIKEI